MNETACRTGRFPADAGGRAASSPLGQGPAIGLTHPVYTCLASLGGRAHGGEPDPVGGTGAIPEEP
jgi:hypothetical protein